MLTSNLTPTFASLARRAGNPVTDAIAGDLVATPTNGPTCSADGISLDGSDDFVNLDDWEWGGATSIEAYVKYDADCDSTCPSGSFGDNCQHEIRDVNNHSNLFNAISNADYGGSVGNNIVSDGSVVRVEQGGYSGSPYAHSSLVYFLVDKYIDLVCTAEPHSCVLDGNNQRTIMEIYGTGSGTMKIAGFMFDDGNSGSSGGGLNVRGIVVLELCQFKGNSSVNGGANYAYSSSTQLDTYGVSYEANTATIGGNDIYIFGSTVTVHTTCPDNWSGSPTTGSSLDITNYGTLSGTASKAPT